MDFLITLLRNPVTIGTLAGLSLGLVCTLVILIKTRLFKKELEDEISDTRYDFRRLEEQMHKQLSISARTQEDLQAAINDRDEQIKSLQANIESVSRKPGRKELKTLYQYDRAIEILHEDSSGTVLAWENALKKAEAEYAEAEKGLKPILRKVFTPDGSK
jgi:uncharacterized protein YlxW (UPF0749 family)